MKLSEIFYVLKARRKMVFAVLALTILSSIVALSLMPKKYSATTTVVVLNYKGSDPLSGSFSPGQLVPAYISTYMSTQVDILKSQTVAALVAERLRLSEDPAWRKRYLESTGGSGIMNEWVGTQLLRWLTVKPGKDSNVLQLTVKASDPVLAAKVANGFAAAYQQFNSRLESNPAKTATVYLEDQVRRLKQDLEQAQNKVTDFRNASGIVDEDRSVDVETTRLNTMERELVAAQGALMEALPRQREAVGAKGASSPDIISDALIQNLKLELGKAVAKLASLSSRYTTDHPAYTQQAAEVDKLRAELKVQTALASEALGINARILSQRESDLHHAVNEQREKVRGLNQKRDQLFLLNKEVENTQHAYQTLSQRLAQTKVQAQANQTDISILASAAIPLTPSSPHIPLTILVSVLTGTLLALGMALLMELRDRRIRFARDVTELLGIPLLAEIGGTRLPQGMRGRPMLPAPRILSLPNG